MVLAKLIVCIYVLSVFVDASYWGENCNNIQKPILGFYGKIPDSSSEDLPYHSYKICWMD
jgi:hypothetical protein